MNKSTLIIFQRLAFWTLFGLFNTFTSYVYFINTDYKFNWPVHLLERLPSYILWAFFCPLIYSLVNKTKLAKPYAGRIAYLALWGIALSAAQRALGYIITYLLALPAGLVHLQFMELLNREFFFLLSSFFDSYIIYCGIVVYAFGRNYYHDAAEKELASARLYADLNNARLQALQIQLQPHFLFNTLHTISALVWSNQDKADRAISLLSQLLRRTLELKDKPLITLKEEFELALLYLDIQKIRFEDKVDANIFCGIETELCLVPVLLVQPLLENIFKHSVEVNPGNTSVSVKTFINGGRLELEISESGAGFALDNSAEFKGTGISNLRQRLDTVTRGDYRLETSRKEEGLFTIRISLPLMSKN